ncbi:DUF3048 domain-containing protein [Streptomyces sp. NPDC054796]
MAWSGSRRAVLAAAGMSLLAAGCQPNDDEDGRSPFTGEKGAGDKVLAVKIDNVPAARPHTGLDDADIVYTEQVEAGLSRLLAVFASRLPATVGPVRSARESDLELLRQFGHPALAYSGAQSKLLPALEAAPLTPLPPSAVGDAYVRGQDRPAPHNLYLKPARALRKGGDASAPDSIGFRFGAAPEGGRAAEEHTVRYPGARFTYTWSAERRRWLVSMDGSPARTDEGKRLSAATVVVQYVTIRDSRLSDSAGSVTPYSETVGSGKALVLRDGKEYEGRWERSSASGGTTFTDDEGNGISFARGPVWVALAPKP